MSRLVLFPRPPEAGGPEEVVLAAAGCAALVVPAIRFEPGADSDALAEALRAGPAPDAVAVTSARAAEAVAAVLGAMRPAPRVRLAAVGSATARPLREAGLDVDVPPQGEAQGAAALAAHLLRTLAPGARVLFPRGNLSLGTLPDALRAAGVQVRELEVYRTVDAVPDVEQLRAALDRRWVAAAVFTSPSGVEALRAALGPGGWKALAALPAVAPGRTTETALRAAGAVRVERAADPGRAGVAAALAKVLGEE
ncbi:MAG: uroporphyrinogen-III synthase [Candidatus Eisenbacteria bacterium]|nr:uroporphyrinogen-III synthase [Candidatus Eisenbacteria bacterium]